MLPRLEKLIQEWPLTGSAIYQIFDLAVDRLNMIFYAGKLVYAVLMKGFFI